ncbi:MAG TPA: hypothetical protein VEZ90_12245 [Blastocatellia bacterium]|nr:hypothetical protein [Blastocatellia bacterium]
MKPVSEPQINDPVVKRESGGAVFLRRQRALLGRVALLPVFVFVCLRFRWSPVVLATTECLLHLSHWLGIPMSRFSSDTLLWKGQEIVFELDCCQMDVFCAAIPLIWNLKASVTRNLTLVSGFFAGLFVFNIIRLEAGFVLYCSHGVPWIFAHDYVGGLNLFVIFLWVVRRYKIASSPPALAAAVA